MKDKSSFFKESINQILKVLCIALCMAITLPYPAWLFFSFLDNPNENVARESWQVIYVLLAPLFFCSALRFYDDKYTGLRLLGAITGAIAGILLSISISDGLNLETILYSLLIATIFASIGVFVVSY